LTTLSSAISDIWMGPTKIQIGSCDVTMCLSGMVCSP